MTLVIRCEEGAVVEGENERELVARLEAHLRDAHPELCGHLSADEILALADDEPAGAIS